VVIWNLQSSIVNINDSFLETRHHDMNKAAILNEEIQALQSDVIALKNVTALYARINILELELQSKSSEIQLLRQEIPALQKQLEAIDSRLRVRNAKFLVFSRFREDIDWIAQYLSDYPHAIYTREPYGGGPYNLLPNKGNEAAVYMHWIVQNYDDLPPHVMFLHAHRFSWHSETDAVHMIKKFRWGEQDYISLSTSMGTPIPHDAKEWSTIAEVWDSLYAPELGYPLPEEINCPCCAQFAVTRNAILRRSKNFYQNMLNWLLTTEMETHYSGRVLEHTWHLIFGKPPLMLHSELDRCKYVMDCD